MNEETLVIALLCFVLGLLLRGEIGRFRKKKQEVPPP